MKKNATVICFNSLKGGVGKSVLSYNFAVYLARKHLKILYIDTDFQENSTSNFHKLSSQQKKNSSIYRAFLHDSRNPRADYPDNFHPVPARKNIDLMASSQEIDNASKIMSNNNKDSLAPYVMLHAFTALDLVHKYDVILIDTHNNMALPTVNALVVSDYVISPIIPNRYGITAISGMMSGINQLKQSLLNPATQQSMVTCQLFFVGNLVRFNTKTSHDFMASIRHDDKFIATFHDREIFNKSTTMFQSVYDVLDSNNNQKIVDDEISPEFAKIQKKTIG